VDRQLLDSFPTPAHETRCQMGRSEETAGGRLPKWRDESELKTWPATPVEASLAFGLKGLPKSVGVAS